MCRSEAGSPTAPPTGPKAAVGKGSEASVVAEGPCGVTARLLGVEGPGVPVGLSCSSSSCSVRLFHKVVFWPRELAVEGSGTLGAAA